MAPAMRPTPQPDISIRAVIFDIGGVLLRTDDTSGRDAWEQRLGLATGELERLVFGSAISQQAALGLVSEDAVWAHMATTFGLNAAQQQALEHDFWSGEQLDTTLVQYLRALRPRYRTAFLSNAWSGAREVHTHRYKIADAVDVMVLSCEVGLAKPDPRIYRLTAERLGVPPEAAVFVDDIERNVIAAREVGMRGVQFVSAEQTVADLRRMLGAVGGT
jgi:putative hydrolase of the HAD superfamily